MELLFGSWKLRVGEKWAVVVLFAGVRFRAYRKFLAPKHHLNSPIIHSFRNIQLV